MYNYEYKDDKNDEGKSILYRCLILEEYFYP